jgi:large subunit ribosomal protein L18
LSVKISLHHISAQLIDDSAHATLAAVSTIGSKDAKGTMTERAAWVGTQIAKQAKSAKVSAVVLDRGSKLYHGRIAALADAARKEGMEF